MKNGPDAAIHATSWSEPPTGKGVQRTNGTPTYDVAPACCNAGSPQLVCCWSADPWMGTESPEYPTVAWNGLSRQSHLDQPRDKTWGHGRKPAAEGQGDSPWVPCWQGGHAKAARGKAQPLEQGQGWRAVCAQRCKYGSGRGTRHALWANGPYSTQRPHPLVEGGRPRCRDGNLLCPAQLPGAPHALAANGLIGINSFVGRPEVAMDNNTAERILRNPVVGRKNYYGSGSVWSAHLAAMLFSVIQTV